MSEISCKYCGRDGMDKHQNLVHVCDRATVEQRYDEADARIASLEAQLAAAQERERAVVELMRTIFHPDHWHNSVGAMVVAVHAALAAASEKGCAE